MEHREHKKEPDREIRLVLIGRTGSGISASGNSILQQVCFQSDSSGSSVTKTCCIGTSKRNGMIVKVVDTPGLFSNIMTVDEIKLAILNCFSLISHGPHVIVYVLRIGRFTEEEIQGVKRFLQIFRGNPLQYTMVLFTGQDDLEWNEMSNEEYLNSAPIYLKKMVEACSRRCVFFNNRLSNSVTSDLQLDEFFKTVGKILEENRIEMPYYTNQMCTEIEEDDFKAKHKKRILTQMKRGGVAFATGLFMFAITGDTLFSVVVGIGTGIAVLSYVNYVK
ncbi:uncharacterized protein LOC134717706 [Mytilus trossulus]|uniref:uncharacterized protein LOC134717706 n=1 Tax=Mytilus trossulus TaxID=6551 RepID=UPI0030068479